MTNHIKKLVLFAALFSGCVSFSPSISNDLSGEPVTLSVDENGVGVIHLSGKIGYATSDSMRKALDIISADHKIKSIQLRIDSGGGVVGAAKKITDALAISNLDKKVECVVYGRAMSAAFYILQTCPVRKMNWYSVLMMHRASMFVGSVNAFEAAQVAQHLDELDEQLAKVNCGRLNVDIKTCRGLYHDHDFYMSSFEALALGAVDEVL